jgi:hypothetical protein
MASVGAAITPAVALSRAGAFVPCADYDQFSAIGSPDQVVSGLPYAGAVLVRHVGGAQPPQTLTAASVGLPQTAAGRFGQATASVDVNLDGCADLVVGVPNALGGVGRVVVVPGSGDALAIDRAVVLDPTAAGIVAGDELGWSVTATRVDSGTLIVAGAPAHNVATASDAGALVSWLIPDGGPDGFIPAPAAPVLWTQGAGGLLGTADPDDHFGAVLSPATRVATGSLAVGIPDEDVGSKYDTGAVAVLSFTGAGGLAANTLVWQGSGIPGTSKSGDNLGAAVVVDSSGIVGVGIPGKDANGKKDSGAVVVRNPSGGLSLVTQNTKGVPDKSEKYDHFGAALADVFGIRGTEVSSLVVGVPDEDLGKKLNVGAVTYIDYSEVTKLTYGAQKAAGLPAKGRFGWSLQQVSGDWANDEDTVDHLFIGAPGQSSLVAGQYFKAGAAGVTHWEAPVYFAP